MPFRIRFTPEAEADLIRLYEWLIERDFVAAEKALSAIQRSLEILTHSPFTCRKASGSHPRLRELIIPFGHSGYVALFEIEDAKTVTILAMRHQREDDRW
ncbi:MAG: type II toxin-antitoxin system RelE/ParE family toxin [Betaproteobacteria bacterium]|nr:type II toxin-antitoxin system RelE/ParE family toxin [Betaproteobacteria bacterium]